MQYNKNGVYFANNGIPIEPIESSASPSNRSAMVALPAKVALQGLADPR
jgi:hypothetical protein